MSNNIIQGGPIPKKDYYKVYVRSCTYNQSQYIEDCLNGVALQKTDFPFVHHVIDDCSTDGEQEVIKAWIERECDLETAEYYDNDICTITLAKNKSNPNCTLVAYFLKRNMYRERVEKEKLYTPWREACPYEALCEGDDYWIDSNKLQDQVNALDKTPNATMCHTSFRCVDQNKDILNRPRYENYKKRSKTGDCFTELLIHGNYPMTLTVLFRNNVFLSDIYKNSPEKYDYALFLIAASMGDFIYLNKEYGCYRYVETGAMATGWVKGKGTKVQLYFLDLVRKKNIIKHICLFDRIKIYVHFLSKSIYINKNNKNRRSQDLCRYIRENKILYCWIILVPIIKIRNRFRRKSIADVLDYQRNTTALS